MRHFSRLLRHEYIVTSIDKQAVGSRALEDKQVSCSEWQGHGPLTHQFANRRNGSISLKRRIKACSRNAQHQQTTINLSNLASVTRLYCVMDSDSLSDGGKSDTFNIVALLSLIALYTQGNGSRRSAQIPPNSRMHSLFHGEDLW